MKFKFRPSKTPLRLPAPDSTRKRLRMRGFNTLRAIRQKSLALNYYAEDFGKFVDVTQSTHHRFSKILSHLKEKFRQYAKKEPRLSNAYLLGVLCALAATSALSGALIIYTLFFGYSGSYTNIRIPNLTVLSVDEAVSVSTDIFEYEVIYSKNKDIDRGKIISQSPSQGIIRRLYKGTERLKITLTVSEGGKSLTLPQTVGRPLRDTELMLKNSGINVRVIEEYSSTVPSGTIIFSSHEKGTILREGESITLRVSLGRKMLYVAVPDLRSLGEHDAIRVLETCGLKVGKVNYETSKSKIGTVISQSVAEGTVLPEGSKVSFSVSGGLYSYDN